MRFAVHSELRIGNASIDTNVSHLIVFSIIRPDLALGMLLGNTMTAISLGLDQCLSQLTYGVLDCSYNAWDS